MVRFWNPLLEASGELLGLSWEGLGPLLGAFGPPKKVPRGWHSLRLGCLLSHLASFVVFFLFGAPPGALLGGFWPHLGAIWAHLRTIFRDFWSTSWDAAWTLGSTMTRQVDQQKMVPIISKQPGPAECAKRLNVYLYIYIYIYLFIYLFIYIYIYLFLFGTALGRHGQWH